MSSARALIVEKLCVGSFDQNGTSPQRMSTISRCHVMRFRRITGCQLCGATFHDGGAWAVGASSDGIGMPKWL
jgi:hypothetical protein